METEQVKNAVQTMLAGTNTNQNLNKPLVKRETTPNCLNNDSYLLDVYNSNDLEFTYVFDLCKSLKPLKGIDINLQQVEFWFREFIRMGWNKRIFDKQFEFIKRATLFNRIDFENWLKTEIMYNEHDFNVRVKEIIESKIQRGKFLKDKKIELTDAEKQEVDLALAKEIELAHNSGWYEARETYTEKRRRELREKRNNG